MGIDVQRVLSYRSKSKLDAVKYVKSCSDMSLLEAKEYVEKIWDDEIVDLGTITWFNCNDQLPIKNDKSNGIWVLCYFEKNSLPEVVYYWWENGFSFGKRPTHWAYINYPDN